MDELYMLRERLVFDLALRIVLVRSPRVDMTVGPLRFSYRSGQLRELPQSSSDRWN
jgi:hypothetical protein